MSQRKSQEKADKPGDWLDEAVQVNPLTFVFATFRWRNELKNASGWSHIPGCCDSFRVDSSSAALLRHRVLHAVCVTVTAVVQATSMAATSKHCHCGNPA